MVRMPRGGPINNVSRSVSISRGHKKKDVRNFGQMAAVYFLGRLQVHAPELATSAALGAYIGTQTELELLKASDRCLEQFGQVGELFGSIGLEEEAKK